MTTSAAQRLRLAILPLLGMVTAAHARLGPPSDWPVPAMLRVESDRPHLQLGRDSEARLVVQGPEDVGEIDIRTQQGRVFDISRVGPGRFVARYVPPAERHPQIAILAATGRRPTGLVHGWLALPLWGAGHATVRTSPGARVSVDIAGTLFGPLRADGHGVASIAVNVPPGVTQGFDGKKHVDLRLPPVSRAYAAPARTEVRADRAETLAVRVYAVTASGAPSAEEPVATVSRGILAPLRPRGPGVFETEISLGPGPAVPVELRVAADETSPPATVVIDVTPGPPSRLELNLPEGPLRPGAPDALSVRVSVTDAAGNGVDAAVPLRINLGTIDEPERVGPGTFAAHCRIPPRFGGHDRLEVVASVQGEHGEIHTTAWRPLVAGPPAAVMVSAPRHATADGSTKVAVAVDVRDRDGNAVKDLPAAAASSGKIGAVEQHGDRFVVHWVPPRADDPTSGTVAVRAGEFEQSAEILLRPRPRRLGFGARAGYLHGLGNLSLLSVGAEAGVGIPALGRPFWVLGEVSYEHGAARETPAEGALDGRRIESTTDLIAPMGSLAWRPVLNRWWVASMAVGAGALFVRNRVAVSDQPAATEQDVVPALQATMGLGLRLGPGHAFIEGRYRHSVDVQRRSLTGPLSAVGAYLGYALEIL